ncbi:hypothetical protein ACWE42_14605 [Sutcliffiella cohnii]
MNSLKLVWESPNGKYKVMVKKDSQPSPLVGHWKMINGKQKDVRYKDLPQYVKDQINSMVDSLK